MQAGEQSNFGKYQILEKLAEGRFSTIYKARLEGIGGFHRLFAIRKLPPTLSSNPAYVDRLVEESKLAGLLSHANIVQILDLGQIDESYYIAMEYINGKDLGTILRRCRAKNITLPLPHALFMILEALKGLDYAHQRKVLRGGRPVPLNLVHRGLCPSNVLASLQGEVKITDFGLSRAHKSIEKPSPVRMSYQSPEQLRGGSIDHRSDIYSLGVVLYEMLCGKHPFLRANPTDTQKAILEHRLKSASAVNPDIPYSLEVILEQALATDPDDRFQTAAAFKESVEGFFHDAGFIFSHSTLASFIKGLFPQQQKHKPVIKTSDQETVPLSKNLLPLDDESEEIPTSINNLELLDAPTDSADYPIHPLATATPIDTSVSSTSASFGPSGSANDDSTLILRPPSQDPISSWQEKTRIDENDDNTLAQPRLSDEKTSVRGVPDSDTKVFQAPPSSGQETRPFPIPTRNEPEIPAPAVQIPLSAQETAPMPIPDYDASLSGEALPSPPPQKVEAQKDSPSSVRNSKGLWPVVALVGILAAFFFGQHQGKSKGVSTPTGTIETPVTQRRPRLLISGPVDTKIEVGDRFYQIDASGTAELNVDPDEPVVVQIQAPGHEPTEFRYTPKANGIRKLTLKWIELEPSR